MSKQGETKFKEKVIKDLEHTFGENIKILKTQERGRRGVLDLIICLFGDYIDIELKIVGKVPDPLQKINIEKTIRAGGYSFWTDPEQWPHHFEVLKSEYLKA